MTDNAFGTQDPIMVCSGFCQAAGPLKIVLGYSVYSHGGIMLFAMEQMFANAPVLWRRFWVTRESAVSQAGSLCDDAAQYLDTVSPRWRPAEDLDFDDFTEHLRAFIEGSMH